MAAHLQPQPKKFMPKNDNMKKQSSLVIRSRQVEHNKAQEGKALDKILQTIHGLKAEVGTWREAMDRHGVRIDGEPEPKHGQALQFEKQKRKSRVIAKEKGKTGNRQSKPLVPNREISVTGSDEEE